MWTIWPPAKPYSLYMTNCNLYFSSENLLFTISRNVPVPYHVSGRREAVRPESLKKKTTQKPKTCHPGSAPRIASFHLSFQHLDSVSCPQHYCDIIMVQQQKACCTPAGSSLYEAVWDLYFTQAVINGRLLVEGID